MKSFLLLLLSILFSTQVYSQGGLITGLATNAVDSGINVNVKTIFGQGTGYLSNSYTIVGNQINLKVCYWYVYTLPIIQLSNDIFIPIQSNLGDSYIINVSLYLSASDVDCDYSILLDTQTTTFLSVDDFTSKKKDYELFPNPNKGIFTINLNNAAIKNISVTIFNILGEIVHSSKPNDALFDIDISDLPKGVYFAKIVSNSHNETLKFLKK